MKPQAHRRSKRHAGRAIAFVLGALAVLGTPALLFAHARLVRSSPAGNATVSRPIAAISLWFSERPEPRFTSIKLLDSAGAPVTLGRVAELTGDTMAVTVPISGLLAPGRYTVVWRTAAADGHMTSGRFRFAVATNATATSGGPQSSAAATTPPPSNTAAESPSTSKSNALIEPAPVETRTFGERWAEFVAVLTLIGAVVFRLTVLPGARWSGELAIEAADRARRLAEAALVLFIVATIIRAISQAALMPGAGSSRFSAVAMLVHDTRWGRGWAVGAAGGILAIIGLATARASLTGWVITGLGVIGICLGEGLTGHAGTSAHFPLAVATDLAHVLGAGGWIGGLAVVLLSGMPSLRRLGENEAATAGSRLVRAYHGAALQCVTIVLVTAIIAAWLRLPRLSALWTAPYGQALLWKIGFVVVLLLFGWYHWRRVVTPEWRNGTRRRFRRTGIAELLVGAIVIATTVALVSLPLPQ